MSGFIGRHLAALLLAEGHEIVGTTVSEAERAFLSSELRSLPLHFVDVTDQAAVHGVVSKTHPEWIVHLAGQAYVIPSYRDPRSTFEVNVLGTIHLLDAVKDSCPDAKVAIACSGAEYGSPKVLPIREDIPLEPVSPYGVSKATQDMLALQYHLAYGLRTFRLRLFGTTGPGKLGDAPNDFASQIARIEADGGTGVVRVGNLSTSRDISDVRDVARAMVSVLKDGVPEQAYNIGRGEAVPIRKVLEVLCGLSPARLQVSESPARIRPCDEPSLYPDVSRIRGLGWRPEIPLNRTLADVLDFWRTHPDLIPAARGG